MAIFPGSAIPSAVSDYEIENSLRFNPADSPGLGRTPGSEGNRRTWTVSFWFKYGSPVRSEFFSNGTDGTHEFILGCEATSGALSVKEDDGSQVYKMSTSAKLRDPSAWYHAVVAMDTTESTDTDRIKMWINGDRQTAFNEIQWPDENLQTSVNTTVLHTIGYQDWSDDHHFDGYLAEYYFIDGTAYDADDFGELSSTTNQWIPKDASDLTFGTNGFYQKYGGTPLTVDAFTSTGADTWTCPTGVTEIELLVVAGGGGGGGGRAGGGGAGGVIHDTSYTVVPGVVYDLSVGAGGAAGASWGTNGTDGSDSVWNVNAEGSGITFTADGGGKGSGTTNNAYDGGSGGGSRYNTSAGGSATQTSPTGATGYGNVGGASSGSGTYSGGGGGGAGAVGGSSLSSGVSGKGGAGGAGREFSTFSSYGVSGFFAGGGGGGAYPDSASSTGGAGGSGGGGTGARDYGGSITATAGTANTGSGGGGGAESSTAGGGAGGSGVILISYGISLGTDSSGEGNNFTVTNLVATDQMVDTPTNNFATLNPLDADFSGTLSEGNLQVATGGGMSSTFHFPASGKWYWEYTITGGTATQAFPGIATQPYSSSSRLFYYSADGKIFENTVGGVSYGASYTTGDVIGVAANVDDGEVTFYKNNSSQGVKSYTYFDSMTPHFRDGGDTVTMVVNFGQDSSFAGNETAQGNQDGNSKGDFYYTPPTDYLALCTDNLSAPEIALPGDNFNTVLYTGNGSTQAITGIGFRSDLTWVKIRSAAANHGLFDSIRGVRASLSSNTTTESRTAGADQDLYAWGSDGFSVGDGVGDSYINTNVDTATYASWNWKAGGAPTVDNSAGAGATPTAGSVKIDGSNLGSALAGTIAAKRLSANTTSGFSIVQYVGTGSGATIAHGLSQAPDMVISKSMDDAYNWRVGGEKIGLTSADYSMRMDTTAAEQDLSGVFGAYPSASVWTIGDDAGVNVSTENYIAYCFHSVEGYSKVGSYVGNGNADGTFVYTGFKPARVVAKRVDSTASWPIVDNKRNVYNVADKILYSNLTDAVDTSVDAYDFVSNGFKIRDSDNILNTSSGIYLYIAFAESPFKYSNAR